MNETEQIKGAIAETGARVIELTTAQSEAAHQALVLILDRLDDIERRITDTNTDTTEVSHHVNQ